jgi:hypothetical protein
MALENTFIIFQAVHGFLSYNNVQSTVEVFNDIRGELCTVKQT